MLKGPLYISIYLKFKFYFNNYLEKILFMFSTKTQQLLYLERKTGFVKFKWNKLSYIAL